MFTSSLLPATLTYLSEEPMGGVLMRAKLVSWENWQGHEAVRDQGRNSRHCTVGVDKKGWGGEFSLGAF